MMSGFKYIISCPECGETIDLQIDMSEHMILCKHCGAIEDLSNLENWVSE